jgi:putative membrane protein
MNFSFKSQNLSSMKKIILISSMLCCIYIGSAQQTPTNKKPVNKAQQKKNTIGSRSNADTIVNNNGTSGTTGTMDDGSAGTSGKTGSGSNRNTGTGTTGTTGAGNAGTTGTTGSTGTTGNNTSTGTTGNNGTMGSTGTTGTGTSGTTGTAGSGTTGSGNMGTSGAGTTGTTGTTDHSGMNQGSSDMSGSMISTGRYQALGITTGNLHRKDVKFIVMAASSNNLELQLSQMAQQRATSQAVKDFAAMMVQHHTKAGQEMRTMLAGKGASVPDTALLPMHRLQMETVAAAQGAAFDKAYMRIMVDAHEEDVDEYEDETTDARDADIRAFTTRMLPILQTHYAQAKEVRKQVK